MYIIYRRWWWRWRRWRRLFGCSLHYSRFDLKSQRFSNFHRSLHQNNIKLIHVNNIFLLIKVQESKTKKKRNSCECAHRYVREKIQHKMCLIEVNRIERRDFSIDWEYIVRVVCVICRWWRRRLFGCSLFHSRHGGPTFAKKIIFLSLES